MKFCSNCGNMYYIKISEDVVYEDGKGKTKTVKESTNKLEYYCRKCGNVDKSVDGGSMTVSSVISENLKKYMLNPYTKLDPTLPHVNNIPCPNARCPSNEGNIPTSMDCAVEDKEAVSKMLTDLRNKQNKRDVIYYRYDNTNMKYVCICTLCNTEWTLDK